MKKIYRVILFSLIGVNLFAQKSPVRDSITIAVAPAYDSVSGLHRFFLGESYRKLWAAPVTMRIVHIDTEKGGLVPVEKGGGLQTKSLRLKDKTGKEWVLRSIQKYPERGLAKNLRKTIAKDILQDQVVTGHPYAALTFPVFAAAIGLDHTNPEVVYFADDKALGEFRKEFGNSVLLLEEREPPATKNVKKTENIQDDLEDNSNIRIDQHTMLRARLLNLLLGDWDRHEGQWKWATKEQGDKIVYEPVPFDQDKVFYNTSGLFPKLLSHQSLKENLQGYHKDIRDIGRYNYNNRYFDRYFLNELNKQDWEKEISWVQEHVTDSVINAAMLKLPASIYQLSAKRIITVLKERRENLRNEGVKYYKFLARNIDIPATNKSDIIDITTLPGDSLEVSLADNKNRVYYNRTFSKKETKEIKLYGLSGTDSFIVTGTNRTKIKMRMIGGAGNDIFQVGNNVHSRKRLFIYDSLGEQNTLPSPGLARIRTSQDSIANSYSRKTFKYDRKNAGITFFFSRDYGLLAGLGFNYYKHGFRKEPFAENHRFTAAYSTARQSLNFSYSGYFTRLFKKSDLSAKFVSFGPYNVSNFFGIGNETIFSMDEDKEIEYYRNRYDLATGEVRIYTNFQKI